MAKSKNRAHAAKQGSTKSSHDDPPVKRGQKTRKRKSRKAKKLLAGSNHKQLSMSLRSRGTTTDNAVPKKKKQKNKGGTTAEKLPTDYGDDRRTVVVYTDGACTSNGKCDAAAGIGVWWDSGDERNLSERCPGLQTSTRAEIFAIVRLLEVAPIIGKTGRLVIRTDSLSTINCVKKGPRWESPGKKGKDIDMIRYLLALLSLRVYRGEVVVFEHVRGHSNNVGNDGADSLAKRGTTEPTIRELDWSARRQLVESIRASITSSGVVGIRMEGTVCDVIEEIG